jgi:hypothetical protein
MARGMVLLPSGKPAPDAAEKAKSPETYKSRAELVADNTALANTLMALLAALEIIKANAAPVPGNDGPMILTPLERAIRGDKKLAECQMVATQALGLVEQGG